MAVKPSGRFKPTPIKGVVDATPKVKTKLIPPISGKKRTAKQQRTVVARQTVRQATRRALTKGMPVKASKKGLGITQNEGGPKLQKAIKTLGYSRAENITQNVKKRQQTKAKFPSGSTKRRTMKKGK